MTILNRHFLTYANFVSPGDGTLVVTYGVPIWSLSVLYLPLEPFFWFQFKFGKSPFFDPWNVLSPGGGPTLVFPSPMGYQYDSFLFYIWPYGHFFNFNLKAENCHFPLEFLISRRWTNVSGPLCGTYFSLFLFSIIHYVGTFMISIYERKICISDPLNFNPPKAGPSSGGPLRGPNLSIFLFCRTRFFPLRPDFLSLAGGPTYWSLIVTNLISFCFISPRNILYFNLQVEFSQFQPWNFLSPRGEPT